MVFAECSCEMLMASSANPMLHCVVAADHGKLAPPFGGGEVSAYCEYSFLKTTTPS